MTQEYDPEVAMASVKQEDDIMAEQREKPRVGVMEDIKAVAEEAEGGSEVMVVKARELGMRYKGMRRIRRDGSCFLRALLFGAAEWAAREEAVCEGIVKKLEGMKKPLMERYGEHFEDFHDVIYELFVDIKNGKLTPASLYTRFQDSTSDYVAYYGRFAASHYIQTHPDDFQPFLDLDITTYCQTQIETVGTEFEHPSIIALTTALAVPVKIEYLDLSPGTACNSHTIPDDATPQVHLLYRPGHYDLIYPL
eukprot:TRINITY_DN12228_c1_g1_i1.p1 TRINITY_DN12228_c1_g1~~TRINITY_DN12228_c1_g1_i1.p1  ORF type:complete len:251 (+),score=86.37 TRINITY_DN12228_c1_g1_i1:99-851(+)